MKDYETLSMSEFITRVRVLVSGGCQEVVAVAARGPYGVTRRQAPPSD